MTQHNDDRDSLGIRVLITDGGEMEPPEQDDPDDVQITRGGQDDEEDEADAEQDSEAADEQDQSAQDSEEEPAEEEEEAEQPEAEEETEAEEEEAGQPEAEEETEAEAEEAEEEEGGAETTILDLTIDGLYLDLLGLEVDLDEVSLDITANPGEGKLLGNLLSAVGGLLDSPGALLGGDGGSLIPSMPSLNPIERAKSLASGIADRLRSLLDDAIAMIPFEQLLTTFFTALVERLLPVEGVEEEEAEPEAASA